MASEASCDSCPVEPKPDVLFITRKWAPAMGGMETYSHRLAGELASLATLDVIALPGQADGQAPSALALAGFPFTVLARWLARDKAPDVLHLGDMAIWPLGLLAALAFGRTRVAISAHGTDVAYHRRGGLKGALYGAYLRLGARLLGKARIIANSAATREVAAETGWRTASVVPLAADMAGPASDGTHDGAILFAGRLVERKGAAWFIRDVLPGLPEGLRLQVAGTVWDKAEAALLDHPRVEFLGRLQGAALARAYARALCVIVPNIPVKSGEYEGFGLVAPEAAAAGGVVLAAACDGLLDAVIDGETGFHIAPGDAAAWQARIAEIAGWTDEKRRTFVTRAQAIAAEFYSWPRVARQTLAAIIGD